MLFKIIIESESLLIFFIIFGYKTVNMLKVSELKEGDILKVLDEGIDREGVVVDTSHDENMALVDNGVQEFWYPMEQLVPLPVTEERLINLLGFEKEVTPDGVKYKKGPFRVLIHDPGNNTNVDVWYREDKRHFHNSLYVHQLQNLHLQMTKVPLERVETA